MALLIYSAIYGNIKGLKCAAEAISLSTQAGKTSNVFDSLRQCIRDHEEGLFDGLLKKTV